MRAVPISCCYSSAKTTTAIAALTTDLHDYLKQAQIHLADIAATLQQGRKRYSQRRFVICQQPHEAIANLATLPPQLTATRQTDSQNAEVVWMFSGQGAQYVNMGLDLYKSEPVFQRAIDTCMEILEPLLGLDLREIIYPSGISANPQPRTTESNSLHSASFICARIRTRATVAKLGNSTPSRDRT